MVSTLAFVLATAIFWLITIGIHELGHWLAFKFYNKDTKIQFTPLGFETGTGHDCYDLTPMQLMFVSYAGVFAGILPFIFIKTDLVSKFIYGLMCAQDMIYIAMGLKFFKSKKTWFEIEFDNFKSYAKTRGIKIWRTKKK